MSGNNDGSVVHASDHVDGEDSKIHMASIENLNIGYENVNAS